MATKRDEFLEEVFSVLALGEPLRNAIDRIKEASLGALIVLCEPEEMKDLMEGGFVLYTDFSPQKLYELAKMDGAIIVSKNIKKIYGANLHLQPNHNIETDESGTRHRTAHRIALQTGNMVVTISERRNKVTVYKGKDKYVLDSIGDLLIKSSQAIMSLEKYSNLTNSYLNNLNFLEYERLVALDDVLSGIRFFSLLFNMEQKVIQYILELGTEGKMLKLQHDEIMLGHKKNFINLIRDYAHKDKVIKPERLFEKFINSDMTTFNEDEIAMKLLGYEHKSIMPDSAITARGYRLLDNINSLNKKDVENIVEKFEDVTNILNANAEELEEIKGISKIKSSNILRINKKYKSIIELENL